MIQAAAGALLAAAVAALAWRARALTAGGALAAFAVGAAVFGAGGWRAALVLLAFFVPSTLLSHAGSARKRAAAAGAKHGARDARQVLANGGIAAACVLAAPLAAPLVAAFAGAFAAASADTWGTEIGTLSRAKPRSIVTFRPVAPGLSGGVTITGTLATLAGAACVAAAAAALGLAAFWPVAVAGAAGATLDSLLGASLQALRWCPACDRPCESDPHACGTRTTLRRGLRWIENDAVNVAATCCGAAIAAALAAIAPKL